jgi:hypothetical protein
VTDLSRAEAEASVQKIAKNLEEARVEVLRFWNGRGWLALGYHSFAACAQAKFGKSVSQVYRLKDAALVQANVSPTGENIPERHTRVLRQLPEPSQQVRAYERAQALALAEQAPKVTETHVQKAVQVERAEAIIDKNPLVKHMVTSSEISALAGKEMVERLERLKPTIQAYVLDVIGRYGLTCPELVTEFGQMKDRKPGQESRTLEGIEATGTIAGTPIRKATMTDLRRARYAAQQERFTEALERERREKQIVPVIITVYRGDPARTLKALREALQDEGLGQLFAHMQEEMVIHAG